MTSKPIFISHAAVDDKIADVVVDILNTAVGINVTEQVFCTSLEGMKIPPGKDFKEFVREQIQEPKIVILLISKNYLASQFCLAELGASWAMAHRIIPMLIQPADYGDMKAVLANVHALKIDDASDWNEALQVFKDEFGIDPNVNRWERKRDEQLKRLKPLYKKQPDPPLISSDKFNAIQSKLQAANEEIVDLESEVARLEELNEAIKATKDAAEVSKAELESLPTYEGFQELCAEVARALDALPGIVGEALYREERGEFLPWPTMADSDRDYTVQQIQESIEGGYLVDREEEGASLDESSPPVKAALDALAELTNFMSEHSDELGPLYVEQEEHQFSIRLRQFWNTNFY